MARATGVAGGAGGAKRQGVQGLGGPHTVEYDLTFFAIATLAVVFAGISKGGFGSGAAFAATPLLALILEPGQAVGLMLPLLMLMDVTALRPYWGKWDGRAAAVFILGALPGVAIGTAVYRLADPDIFRLLIGLVAITFVLFQMARKYRLIRPAKRPMGDVGGAIAGVVGGLDKTTYQATTVLMFWAINLMKFVPYAMLGIFSWETVKADLFLIPAAIVGVMIGVRAHRIMPERLFFAFTYLLLTATGTKLIWDALT